MAASCFGFSELVWLLRLLDLLIIFLWLNGPARIWSCWGGCDGLRRLMELFSGGMGRLASVLPGRIVWV
jgi:hypothetical protein